MFNLNLSEWPGGWLHFASIWDLAFANVSALLITLMVIWWRQRTAQWFRITMATLLLALLLCISSFSLFFVPPYLVSCASGCPGWRGYPHPVATVALNGVSTLLPLDFLVNLLLLWLLTLGASVTWYLLGYGYGWPRRSRRARLLFVLLVVILPWALLPRYLNPPQPTASGKELRLAVNARRAAESTYDIVGLWVQRLALEDVRTASVEIETEGGNISALAERVCLRGYTYFYLPWRRYRIELDGAGRIGVDLKTLPLDESCWE